MKTFILLLTLASIAGQATAQANDASLEVKISSARSYDPNDCTYNGKCGKYKPSTGEFCDCNYANCKKVAKDDVNFKQCCGPAGVGLNLEELQGQKLEGILNYLPDSSALVLKTITGSFLFKLKDTSDFRFNKMKASVKLALGVQKNEASLKAFLIN